MAFRLPVKPAMTDSKLFGVHLGAAGKRWNSGDFSDFFQARFL